MKRLALTLSLLAAAVSPSAALAAGWAGAARVEVLATRVEAVTVVVREQESRIEITESATARTIAMPSDVLFAFDSARVTAAGAASVRRLAADLDARAVTVAGHTDKRGSAAYNDRLAARRAEAVARVVRAAAPSVAVTTEAVGERRPIASNRTAAGRRRNRRVELVVPR